jgi:hypothetical protein
VRLQGQPDRRGMYLVLGVLLLIVIVVAAYLFVIAPNI